MEQLTIDIIANPSVMYMLIILSIMLAIFWFGFIVEFLIKEIGIAIPRRSNRNQLIDSAERNWLKRQIK